MKSSLVQLIKSVYIIYILIFYKTTYSLHHPFEIAMQNKTTQITLLKHPVYSTHYENKICPLGKLVGVLLVIWIYSRNNIKTILTRRCYNMGIWLTVLGLGFLANINFFIYLLPVAVLDIITYNEA